MRKKMLTTAIVGSALSLAAIGPAEATTPADPNDVDAVDNPTDDNDDEGFDDWGLLGLLGLAGLAGLARPKRRDTDIRTDDYRTRGATDVTR